MLDLPPRAIRGLRMLSYDVRHILKQDGKKTVLRYNFFNTLEIIILMVACGIGIGIGYTLITNPSADRCLCQFSPLFFLLLGHSAYLTRFGGGLSGRNLRTTSEKRASSESHSRF